MSSDSKNRSSKTAAKPHGGRTGSGPRPIWTGTLRLSLVSVPVVLVPATQSSADLALHQIHGPSGKRIKYDKVAPGIGSVAAEDIEKTMEATRDNLVR